MTRIGYFVLDEIDWPDVARSLTVPVWWRRPDAWAPAASSWREGGFFSQYSEFPPGYAVPLHRHDHDEMIVLLDGSCTMSDGRALGTHDWVVLTAGFEYGFTVGEDGMVFLTIRAGRATTTRYATEERVRSARAHLVSAASSSASRRAGGGSRRRAARPPRRRASAEQAFAFARRRRLRVGGREARRREADQDLAAVGGIRRARHQAGALEPIEDLRHAAARAQHDLGELARRHAVRLADSCSTRSTE